MNVQFIEEDQQTAREKYREYRAALKVERNKQIAYLATIYWQLSRGRKVIDATAAIQSAGVNSEGHPVLAIGEAHRPNVRFYGNSSEAIFFHERAQYAVLKFRSEPPLNKYVWHIEAPTPIIPPSCVPPDAKLENLHILWEVERWARVASGDPLLLKRLPKPGSVPSGPSQGPFFVVLAAWDLTPAERAVMAAGLRM